jgi:opacity protein-like surface antigen
MKTLINGCRSFVLGALWMCLLLAASAPAISQSPSSSSATGTPMAVAGGLYMSPKNGQTADQQAADRYACYSWAVKQSNFSPSVSSTARTSSGLQEYRRAMTACLEGRGYAVSAAAPSSGAPAPAVPASPAPPVPVRFRGVESTPELKYRPFEFQIDGGYTAVAGTTQQDLSGGANAGLGFTWFPTAALPLGLRVDGSWSRFGIKDHALSLEDPGFTSGRNDIYGGDADLQLDLAHNSTRYKFYLLGGVGWYRVQTRLWQVTYQSGTVCGWYYCTAGYFPELTAERNTTTEWQKSWNAGLGWEMAVAPGTSFFIEARYRHFLAGAGSNGSHMSFVPVSLGLRF